VELRDTLLRPSSRGSPPIRLLSTRHSRLTLHDYPHVFVTCAVEKRCYLSQIRQRGVYKERRGHVQHRGLRLFTVTILLAAVMFWGSASCCAYFIKIIRRTVPRNNFLSCLFYILFCRYMFRPSLAIFRRKQYFREVTSLTTDLLFCV
jgi:hypothetical protein